MTDQRKSFTHDKATFTVRPLTSYDEYIISSGWYAVVIDAVSEHEGYASRNDAPVVVYNMAADFANLMISTTIDGQHPLAEINIASMFDKAEIGKAWVTYKNEIRRDGLIKQWLSVYKEVNREQQDPLPESGGASGKK